MNFLAELANDARGLMLLKDWLGDGGTPVPQQQAEHRASVCCGGNMGMPCPENVEPNYWNRVKNAIAEVICEELNLKHKFSVTTRLDDSLAMCKVCGCCLKLAVHAPTEHFKQHTTEAMLASYPNYCWKKKELTK